MAENVVLVAAAGLPLSPRLRSAIAASIKTEDAATQAASAAAMLGEIRAQVRVSTPSPEDAHRPLPEDPIEAFRESIVRSVDKHSAF